MSVLVPAQQEGQNGLAKILSGAGYLAGQIGRGIAGQGPLEDPEQRDALTGLRAEDLIRQIQDEHEAHQLDMATKKEALLQSRAKFQESNLSSANEIDAMIGRAAMSMADERRRLDGLQASVPETQSYYRARLDALDKQLTSLGEKAKTGELKNPKAVDLLLQDLHSTGQELIQDAARERLSKTFAGLQREVLNPYGANLQTPIPDEFVEAVRTGAISIDEAEKRLQQIHEARMQDLRNARVVATAGDVVKRNFPGGIPTGRAADIYDMILGHQHDLDDKELQALNAKLVDEIHGTTDVDRRIGDMWQRGLGAGLSPEAIRQAVDAYRAFTSAGEQQRFDIGPGGGLVPHVAPEQTNGAPAVAPEQTGGTAAGPAAPGEPATAEDLKKIWSIVNGPRPKVVLPANTEPHTPNAREMQALLSGKRGPKAPEDPRLLEALSKMAEEEKKRLQEKQP